jgi:hypothetical protein
MRIWIFCSLCNWYQYIPNDSRKVLNDFYGIIINKGKIIERACNDKIKVKWRYSGTERIITNA